MVISNSNKENVKPAVTKLAKASIKQVKSNSILGMKMTAGVRPEEMFQCLDRNQVMNSKDLLKEIQLQQQRLSIKQIKNLFTTLDGGDIGQRAKTDGQTRSMQTFETCVDVDPYNMLVSQNTLDSHRTTHFKSKPNDNGSDYCYNQQQ